jgi:hypothetical protein
MPSKPPCRGTAFSDRAEELTAGETIRILRVMLCQFVQIVERQNPRPHLGQ